jgi:hypothetical protein
MKNISTLTSSSKGTSINISVVSASAKSVTLGATGPVYEGIVWGGYQRFK